MKRVLTRLILTAVLVAPWQTPLKAHPTAFKGAISAMSYNSKDMNELFVHYSFIPRVSLGVKYLRVNERGKDAYSVFPQLSFLLWRWNHELFQANLYTYGGFGGNWANDRKGRSIFYGAEADAEDRRLYFSTAFESLRQSEFRDLYVYKVRGGVAPYAAEFNELASWFILQYDFKPEAPVRHTLTPLMRFFYKSALIEAGSSWKGDWLLNLMVHF